MRSRILVGLVMGTIGGFLGWLLQETLINYNGHIVQGVLPGQGPGVVPMSAAETRTLVYCVGGMIGLFLGAVDGIVESNARKLVTGLLVGALAGIVLGYIGLGFGNAVFNMLGGSSEVNGGADMFAFARQVIARTFGWAFMGLGLGIGSAVATRSPKRIWHGAIGGFLGGFIGGFIFDLLGNMANPLQQLMGTSGVHDVGGPSRLAGFTAIGGLTGFFVGLVEELLKQAWVRVLAGKNEGKDIVLDRPMSLLGRDERCEVPLFGDNSIAVQHAAIRADKNRHTLIDAGTPAGTLVNGQRAPDGGEVLLRDGDMIQIGTHRILFREKATANKIARPVSDAPRSRSGNPAVAMPSHLCPFCGSPKDASGACRCSLESSPPPAYSAPPDYGSAAAPSYSPPSDFGAAAPQAYYAPQTGSQGTIAMGHMGGMGPAPSRLIGVEGPYTGQVFSVLGANVSVGREAGKDITLTLDTTISRSHASLTLENGSLLVYDNGSSNGTYLNGQRLSGPTPVVSGDILQFGSSKFRVE